MRKLADLAIEHNAIIVFEDLNMRFKQIRGGIENPYINNLKKLSSKNSIFWLTKAKQIPENR